MLLHAPAKLNLCLYLGPCREDGLHELCSLFEPLALADLLTVTPAERDAGAPVALLSGSGPTAVGLFADLGSARAAAARLDRDDAIVCAAGVAP